MFLVTLNQDPRDARAARQKEGCAFPGVRSLVRALQCIVHSESVDNVISIRHDLNPSQDCLNPSFILLFTLSLPSILSPIPFRNVYPFSRAKYVSEHIQTLEQDLFFTSGQGTVPLAHDVSM